MFVSEEVIKAGGFKKMPEDITLQAKFYKYAVYKTWGLTLCNNNINSNIHIEKEDYILMMGNDIRKVLFDHLNLDENIINLSFIKEVLPPYIVLVIKNNRFYECEKNKFWKKEGSTIVFFDSFKDARKEIRDKASLEIPNILSSLSIQLSQIKSDIPPLKLIKEFVIGKSQDNENVLISTIESSSPKITMNKDIDNQKIIDILEATDLSKNLYHNKVYHFLHNAMNEEDNLKKFLSLFFLLEIHINTQFKKIKKSKNLLEKKISSEELSIVLETRDLLQKFSWCKILLWKGIDISDINFFKEVKKIRNDISHGTKLDYSDLPVLKLEKLCYRILAENE